MSIFSIVLCGHDGSDEGEQALRHALTLVEPTGRLVVATIAETRLAYRTGLDAPRVLHELRDEARRTRERALELMADRATGEAIVVEGRPDATMLWLTRKQKPTLVVVGSHGHGRAFGVAFGSVATALLHSAPCSVLIARPPGDTARFPRSIVLGADGSRESLEAGSAALELHRRFGSPIRVVVARGGKGVDEAGLRRLSIRDFPETQWDDAHPVDALTAAVGPSDLLVLGSRGLHGWRALGSVSERTAHRAPSSVLIVRGENTPT